MNSTNPGQIITFYSYKGGTGRTMALANIACLLGERYRQQKSKRHLKVLALDWDLEAPGLHRYFRPYLKNKDEKIFNNTPGCLELFEEIEARRSAFSDTDFENNRSKIQEIVSELDLNRYLSPTKIPGLQLMKAGRFNSEYGRRVGQFKWHQLFMDVPGLFAGFAEYLRKNFDRVLVDSRTGISDTGGICSMVLPDKLVVVFTPNQQSLTGISNLAEKAVAYRKASPDARPLIIFPLPSRIEMARPALLDAWRMGGTRNIPHLPSGIDGYQPLFEKLFAKIYGLIRPNLDNYFNSVMLQHVPDYAYGEPIAVMLKESESRLFLRSSYVAFLERLTELRAPWESLDTIRLEREIDERIAATEMMIKKGDFDHALRIAWELIEKPLLPILFETIALAILDIARVTYPRLRCAVSSLLQQLIDNVILTPDLDQETAAEILAKTGKVSLFAGDLSLAINAFRKARELFLRLFGVDSPEAMACGNKLVEALQRNNSLDEAQKLSQELIEKLFEIFGEEHQYTLNIMGKQGVISKQQGDYVTARAIQEKVLEVQRRLLGEEHPDTLTSMNNLALTLADQGDYSEALTLEQEALIARSRVLGEEHPDTLSSMINLANILEDRGDYNQALDLVRKALQIMHRVLGEEHPDTLTSMNNLASTLGKKGEYTVARTIQEEVLEKQRRLLGKEHPDTLNSMNNLALMLADQGHYSEAQTLAKEALEVQRRVLGEEHPNTLASMSNLASIFFDQKDYDAACALEKKTLEVQRRVLGEEHPNTLTSMNNLAITNTFQGDNDSARLLQEKVLKLRCQVLGEGHPDTLTSMNNLSMTLSNQGNYDAACALQEKALKLLRRVLGYEHPRTLTGMQNLATTYARKNDYRATRALLEELLDLRHHVLGKEHPDTLRTMDLLITILRALKDFSAASTLQEKILEITKEKMGESHQETINAMIKLMMIAKEAGDTDRVLALTDRLVKITSKHNGKAF